MIGAFIGGTLKESTDAGPGNPPLSLNTVAEPTWDAWFTSAVADGASVDNFTIAWTSFGPQRIVRFLAEGTFVDNDFIYFDAGTVAPADMPAFEAQDFVCRHMSDGKAILPLIISIDINFIVCLDGSVTIGQKVYGVDGPFVEDDVFDTILNGTEFIMSSIDVMYRVTDKPGPAVTPDIAGLLKTGSKGQSMAQAYGAMLKASPNLAAKNFSWQGGAKKRTAALLPKHH